MNKKILIADDDINIIASLKYVLSEQGFDIIAVTTPEAALENLKTSMTPWVTWWETNS